MRRWLIPTYGSATRRSGCAMVHVFRRRRFAGRALVVAPAALVTVAPVARRCALVVVLGRIVSRRVRTGGAFVLLGRSARMTSVASVASTLGPVAPVSTDVGRASLVVGAVLLGRVPVFVSFLVMGCTTTVAVIALRSTVAPVLLPLLLLRRRMLRRVLSVRVLVLTTFLLVRLRSLVRFTVVVLRRSGCRFSICSTRWRRGAPLLVLGSGGLGSGGLPGS